MKQGLQDYIAAVSRGMDRIGLFLSGGEDTRVLLSLLPENCRRDAFIFLDFLNREGQVAQRAASAYGADPYVHTRSETYYLDIMPQCTDLVGGGSQYIHGHTYGFHHSADLKNYSCVFGGLFSDALLKGSHIKKIKGSHSLPFLPKIKQPGFSHNRPLTSKLLEPQILSTLNQRRRGHYLWISKIRPISVDEWFELWPSSMNKNVPCVHVNRRLFRTYEPFMCKDVVKLSTRIPQHWKLNRRLFHRMAKPLLKPAKHIPHSEGWLPYYPWYVNMVVHGTTWTCRHIATRMGMINGNQGPWGDWQQVMQSKAWKSWIDRYALELQNAGSVFTISIRELLLKNKLKTSQKLNLLQSIYLIHKNYHIKGMIL